MIITSPPLKFETMDDLSQWLNETDTNISQLQIYSEYENTNTGSISVNDSVSTSIESGTTNYVYIDDGTPIISESVTITSTDIVEDKNIIVKSLTKQPSIKQIPLSEHAEDYNTWFVDDFESFEGACGTSNVKYKGDDILINVCESDGKSTVHLVIEVDGDIVRLPFMLKNSCDNTSGCDMILAI